MRPPAIYFRNAPRGTTDLQVNPEGARVGRREGGVDMGEDADEPRQQPPVATAGALPLGPESGDPPATPDEQMLLAALRGGDEAAFETLVNAHYVAMLRVALLYVRNRAVAEEVIQETWLAVLQGLAHFEGRSSLKTWIFRILANRARTRAVREGRSVPFSALEQPDQEGGYPSVDPNRFQSSDEPYPDHWRASPGDWQTVPEDRL